MSFRRISAMAVPGVEPGGADMPEPVFDRVDLDALIVDETYQRNLSERSVTLIRKIVGCWDWRRFKPPVVVRTPEGLHVIDGQHTAIAAATHPKITQIPVMIVDAERMEDRALAFIGHNRDRIAVTPNQLHAAAAAAGDPEALTINQVCDRAGVTVLKSPPGRMFKPGETLSVTTIGALVKRRGAMRARQVLQVLGEAKCAPISAAAIKAVELLLFDKEYRDHVVAEDLTTVIRGSVGEAEHEAKVFASAHGLPQWKALAIVYFKRCKRGRRRAD
jgi:hypothetical protein